MTEEQFSQMQAEVDEKCTHLRNIARWQADGNFSPTVEVPKKYARRKRNSKLRRREIYFTKTPPKDPYYSANYKKPD